MRPFRLLASLSTSVVVFTLLLYLAVPKEMKKTSFRRMKPLVSFTSPGSLFPPSAIISLTDDNSTFFLARPAAFGPDLPKDGLSGPLWTGSGFQEESVRHGGELGCSDVPGWGDDDGVQAVVEGTSKAHPPDGSTNGNTKVLQETSEISGKVVLLKRGGCGFLAKVQWAQRRGGTAVIIGDNVRGGALVRMYAKGDTSGISIPSLFTSHTTAHLLSSLAPSMDSMRKGPVDGANTPVEPPNVMQSDLLFSGQDKAHVTASRWQLEPGFLPRTHCTQPPRERGSNTKLTSGISHLIRSAFRLVSVDDWKYKNADSTYPSAATPGCTDVEGGINNRKPVQSKRSPLATGLVANADNTPAGKQYWKGYKRTQSSVGARPIGNVYSTASSMLTLNKDSPPENDKDMHATTQAKLPMLPLHLWDTKRSMTTLTRSTGVEATRAESYSGPHMDAAASSPKRPAMHDGLWVTLTPTNMSSSPFFDTLLVLVVSPLVTLSFVYILLILRSRIRRRRWRAPKSVVERLPVRTYQTISDNSSSVTSCGSNPTTPLLQQTQDESLSSSNTNVSNSVLANESTTAAAPINSSHAIRDREEEKESKLAAWKRRYGGRQKECVVCLEDYVDGVSQVMSLPCGHEFHVGCM